MTLPKTQFLLLEEQQDWLTIWFNQPESRNALSQGLTNELRQVLESVRGSNAYRGITLRGSGGIFCAGGDLKAFKSNFQGGEQTRDDVMQASVEAGELFDLINQMPQVIVILVEGAAMAGGLGIVCCADVVAVTADARFALTETTLGIPPAQIAPFIVQRLGLAAARRLMLTAARFKGAEAVALGLADYVASDVSELNAIEQEIRSGVLRCAPSANAVTKNIVLATQHLARKEMVQLAAQGFADCMLGAEGREGVSSFVEKRKPSWSVE